MNTTEFINEMEQYEKEAKFKSSLLLFTSIFTDVNSELKDKIKLIKTTNDLIPYLKSLGCLVLSEQSKESNKQVSILSNDNIETKLNNIYELMQQLPKQIRTDINFAEASINASISKATTNIKASNTEAIIDIQNAVKTYSSEDMFNLKESGKSWNEIAKITGLTKEVVRYRVRAYKTKNNIQ